METLPGDLLKLIAGLLSPESVGLLSLASKESTAVLNEDLQLWTQIYDKLDPWEEPRQNFAHAAESRRHVKTLCRSKKAVDSGIFPAPRIIVGNLPWLFKGTYPSLKGFRGLMVQDSPFLCWPDTISSGWAGAASQKWRIYDINNPSLAASRPLGAMEPEKKFLMLGGGYFMLADLFYDPTRTDRPSADEDGDPPRVPPIFELYRMGSPDVLKLDTGLPTVEIPGFKLIYARVVKNQRGYAQTFALFLLYKNLGSSA